MKLLGVCGLLCVAVPGFWHFTFPQEQLEPYQFTTIADTRSGMYRSFHLAPSIDGKGRVLFRANLVGGGQGIFQSDGSTTTQVATTSEYFSSFQGTPAMSENGQIIFLAHRSDDDFGYSFGTNVAGEFLYSNKDFAELGDLEINNGGTVAFKGKRAKGRRVRKQVFLGKAGRIVPIPESQHNQVGTVSLNNLGQVAFSTGEKVYVSDGNRTTLLTDRGQRYFLFSRPVLNDQGMVVVQAASEEPNGQIVKHLLAIEDGHMRVVVSAMGPFRDFVSSHALNNEGEVVFGAILESGLVGIFSGPNPYTDVIVKQGDPLSGSRILEGPVLANHGLNDAGQIVFYARLEDGTEGIYRADPIVSPSSGIFTNSSESSPPSDSLQP